MQEEKRRNTRYKKIKIFTILLTGFLLCYAAVMMYIGGSVNIRELLSSGRVYDFSREELQSSSRNWQYSEEEQGYWIKKNSALKKWKIEKKATGWCFLYITVKEMSQEAMDIRIIYYNKAGGKVIEQPHTLTKGENIIILQYPGEELYRMGIRIYGGKDQFLSIQSMQLRENALGFSMRRFGKLMAVSYLGFLVVLAVFWLIRKRYLDIPRNIDRTVAQKQHNKGICLEELQGGAISDYQAEKNNRGNCLEALQEIYQILIEDVCKWVHHRTVPKGREVSRKLLWCFLFLWMIAANLLGWCTDGQAHRYYMLSLSMIFLMIAVLAWERPLCYLNWKNPLCLAWLWLWIGTLLSDVFVVSDYKWHGIPMLLACGILIFVWNNMKYPRKMIAEISWALEVDFGIAVLFCMIYRTKKLAVCYNGIFPDSQQFSMYTALMLAVFLVEISGLTGEKKLFKKSVWPITGAALSLFFLQRAGSRSGFAAAAVLLGIFAVWNFCNRKNWLWEWKIVAVGGLKAGIIAFLCVCVVHVSTKYLPETLGTEWNFEQEHLVSNLQPEQMADFDALQPGLMKDVQSVKDTDYSMYWKNYIRRFGLTGSNREIRLRRESIPSDNTYIQMMYRYGIFILIPFLLLQISLIWNGIKQFKKGTREDMWVFMIGAVFLCFCFVTDADVPAGHPLWFCYYAGVGYWFHSYGQKDSGRVKGKQICRSNQWNE